MFQMFLVGIFFGAGLVALVRAGLKSRTWLDVALVALVMATLASWWAVAVNSQQSDRQENQLSAGKGDGL